MACERRAHRTGPGAVHAEAGTTALFLTGSGLCTTGTLVVARRYGWPGRGRGALPVVNAALLLGGNAIGVPHLALTRALHR
ncbi:hypothetical protein [Kineococcus rhizosphaerae]|uniref:Uncharacterized protein n=1 Tax=Kineococcus rhizosphaerae TaxID=559628 RepID=A0A2T0QZK0_9ACTN|nr:hypothetical protein [Kineococcus rhizosphaerae]PRY12110.1 hypothetical protein CLV37_11166 [Kineococcus rhizosphaerae]